MKKKVKMKRKETNKIIPSRLYRWVHNYIIDNMGLVCLIIILGFWFGSCFWFPLDEYSNNHWNNHGINNWLLGLLVFVVWELLYMWVCKNDRDIVRDDIIFAKIISLYIVYAFFAVIIPAIGFAIKWSPAIDWVAIIGMVVLVVGVAVSIMIIGWLFYKGNQQLYDIIRRDVK